MTTLSCRNMSKDCLETLSASDSKEIQKVFLVHVHAKHQAQWTHLSKQFQAVSLVTMRNRFLAEEAAFVVAPSVTTPL